MRANRLVWAILLASIAGQLFAQGGGNGCTNSTLYPTYALASNTRGVTNGSFFNAQQSVGTATFDGQGNGTLSVTQNSNMGAGQAISTQTTYSLGANCTGTITPALNGVVSNFVVYAQGASFTITSEHNGKVSSFTGAVAPPACITSTLSGPFAFNANGFVLSGTNVTGVADETGLLQFDGMGNVSATWNVANGATATTVNASGQYTLGANCQGTATLNDKTNMISYAFAFSVIGGFDNFDFIASSPNLMFGGAGHSTFVNPGQAIVNGASGSGHPPNPGGIFALYGQNVATGAMLSPKGQPWPDTLLTTSVTVNGENAPLYYVNTGQINAQMPVDIPVGQLATVIVKNGNTTSNAVAVFIPGVSPGIFAYGNNHAVVTFKDGSLNTENRPAHVGDSMVAYFCGGGPVQLAGALATGTPAPAAIAPISESYSITVGGQKATDVPYVGLTPTAIGLYQANFHVPQVAAGDQPLMITINGQQSNAPVITIAN